MKEHQPLIIAHRGASAEATENTLAAFHEAWDAESDGIEFDVRVTSDAVVVCHHDESTRRIYGKKRVIAETSFEDLAHFTKRDPLTHISSLAEALATVPENKKVLIEVKSGIETVQPIVQDMAAWGRKQNALIITFRRDVIEEFRSIDSDQKAALLIGNKVKDIPEAIAWADNAGCVGIGFDHRLLTEEYVEECHARGLVVDCWTVDRPKRAQKLIGWGVRGITTNDPRKMRAELEY